jgi:ribulose-phosphate 3-epimerase
MEAIQKHANLPLDVHLMIVEPDKYISTFKKLGAKVLTVHYEVCNHLHRTIYAIKEEGMLAGVALNPHTPVSVLKDVIKDIDLVLIMSVNPGFGGQKFIANTIQKVQEARELIANSGSRALIEVDGGVGLQNYTDLIKSGADVLVAGSSVFSAPNPVEAIKKLKTI